MIILPAIDLIDGKVVRLFQGDYGKKEEYGEPLAFAKQFQQQGANHLHVVDLDGAKQGAPENDVIIEAICAQTGLQVEVGGGIRNHDTVQRYINAGVNRVILGTAALRDPAFVKEMVARYKEKIAVGVDTRDGKVAVEGWLETSDADSFAFCNQMRDIGVQTIIYTDIARDGAQKGPNLEAYKRLAAIDGLNIIASGGVSRMQDVENLQIMDVYGAIIGKALYTGGIDLQQALALTGKTQ